MSHTESSKFKEFVAGNPFGNLHQTIEWGDFQSRSALRDKFWPLTAPKNAAPQNGDIEASALVIRQRLPRGKCWLYCPRGPLFTTQAHLTIRQNRQDRPAPREANALANLFSQITALAREQNAVFFRFDPNIADISMTSRGGFKEAPEAIPGATALFSAAAASAGLKLRPAHAHYQPESTLILDLTLSETDLLAQMKPKGRYNIKVAQKHGVKITRYDAASCPPKELEKHVKTFHQLLGQTTSRDGFSGHPQKYYLDLLQTLKPGQAAANHTPPAAFLYLAEYADTANSSGASAPQVIAGTIVTHYKDTAIYYFGASGNAHRNVMAPYLLQWQAISDAKSAGLKYYDFLGIAPLKNSGTTLQDAPQSAPQTTPAAPTTPPDINPASGAPAAPAKSDPLDLPGSMYEGDTFDPSHPWAKVTDFKLKFGGRRVNYMPTYEIVFRPFWYRLILLTKKLKSLLLR